MDARGEKYLGGRRAVEREGGGGGGRNEGMELLRGNKRREAVQASVRLNGVLGMSMINCCRREDCGNRRL